MKAKHRKAKTSTNDPGAILDTLQITERTNRRFAGTWVEGTIGGHSFCALVFREHAEVPSYELDDSRISKLWLRDDATRTVVANFDRGWDVRPSTPLARTIVDLLAAGIAEHTFAGKER